MKYISTTAVLSSLPSTTKIAKILNLSKFVMYFINVIFGPQEIVLLSPGDCTQVLAKVIQGLYTKGILVAVTE